MQEFAAHAVGISKKQARDWNIDRLGRTLESAFGAGDKIMVLLVRLTSGDTVQFIYAPVTARLQEIAGRCGDYLHVRSDAPEDEANNWALLSQILHEGCGLLRLSCSSEIHRPTFEHGLHFVLEEGDPRVEVVKALQTGNHAGVQVIEIEPKGPMTYYPGE